VILPPSPLRTGPRPPAPRLPGLPPRRTEPLRPVLAPPRTPQQLSLDLQPRGR
jgi:hypothetical protein